MTFRPATENARLEVSQRPTTAETILTGVEYLDDCLKGFLPDDFVLIGAYSGAGKTQLCCNIAMANPTKRIHMFALEASEFEIERRLKFNIIKNHYYGDSSRPDLGDFNYVEWLLGMYGDLLRCYEKSATIEFEEKYKNLHVFYKENSFAVDDLIRHVLEISDHTDAIIVDHAHYFDFGDNENRAIKEIAQTARTLALEHRKPIILAAHLRKRDKGNEELVPGLDEFHGSSDLAKIATRVVTLAPGRMTADKCYETFFRVPKNRHDGGVIRYAGQEIFNPKTGAYEKGRYRIGWANQSKDKDFEAVESNAYPRWGRKDSKQTSMFSDNPLKGIRNEFHSSFSRGSAPVQELLGGGT